MNDIRCLLYTYEWHPLLAVYIWMTSAACCIHMNDIHCLLYTYEWHPLLAAYIWMTSTACCIHMNDIVRRRQFSTIMPLYDHFKTAILTKKLTTDTHQVEEDGKEPYKIAYSETRLDGDGVQPCLFNVLFISHRYIYIYLYIDIYMYIYIYIQSCRCLHCVHMCLQFP